MGNYTAQQHIDLFGGLPERGDCAPDPDAIRERAHGPHHLGASKPETPAGGTLPSQGPSAGTSYADGHCDVCGAPVGKHHLSYCDLRGDV